MLGKTLVSSSTEHPQTFAIERPLAHGFAPYVLSGEQLVMIPLMPGQQHRLHAEIFSQTQIMKYFGSGKSFSLDEYTSKHLAEAKQNLSPQYDPYTGRLSRFSWTIITKDGIGGKLQILPTEGRIELAFCISPMQQGRSLARRASELVVAYTDAETAFIATAHPQNIASAKTLEQVRYPDGRFVLSRDPQRQNVPNKYGVDQPRDFFLSRKLDGFSFFSFVKGHVQVAGAQELQEEAKSCKTSMCRI